MFPLICAWTSGLSKQLRRRISWTPSHSLWRYCNLFFLYSKWWFCTLLLQMKYDSGEVTPGQAITPTQVRSGGQLQYKDRLFKQRDSHYKDKTTYSEKKDKAHLAFHKTAFFQVETLIRYLTKISFCPRRFLWAWSGFCDPYPFEWVY